MTEVYTARWWWKHHPIRMALSTPLALVLYAYVRWTDRKRYHD